MRDRTRPTLLAAGLALGVLAPIGVLAPAAGAEVDPTDLSVSTTAGGPGTEVEVTSASCVDEDDASRVLLVRMFSGSGPDERFLGAGNTFDGPAVITVPDWADPDAPAVIEASCEEFVDTPTGVDSQMIDYPDVAFDIEPGVGAPQQATTLSRTELLVGQGIEVEVAGCLIPDAPEFETVVFAGDDLSGRTWEDVVTGAYGELDGGAGEGALVFSDGDAFIGAELGEQGVAEVFAEEFPTTLEPGTYVAVSACYGPDYRVLLFEPQLIEVTGAAAVGDIDLTASSSEPEVTLAGGSCTAGPVQAEVIAEPLSTFVDPDTPVEALAERAPAGSPSIWSRSAPAPSGRLGGTAADLYALAAGGGERALADDGYLEAEVEPDAGGAWSVTDTVDFDRGLALAVAWCGDPFADGFLYDPQATETRVIRPLVPTVPEVSGPPAAQPVPATPSYAG